MKKFVLLGLVSLLIVSGVALAHQSEEQKGSSMQGMMQQMMGQMTKMMDQCTAMMSSDPTPEDQGKQEQ